MYMQLMHKSYVAALSRVPGEKEELMERIRERKRMI
jgi:hypothetical protein